MGRKFDDDDGRTIADMSGLQRRPLLLPGLKGGREKPVKSVPQGNDLVSDPGEKVRPDKKLYKEEMNREERRAAMSGAVAAGLLVAGALIVGMAIIIIIFSTFGK